MSELLDEVGNRPFDRRLAMRLLALLTPQKRRVCIALILALVAAGFELMAPVLLKFAIDSAIDGTGGQAERIRSLQLFCALLGTLAIASLLAAVSNSWLVQRAGQEVLHDLRGDVLHRLLALPMGGLLRQPVGKLLTRTVYDPTTINEFLGVVVVQLLRDFLVIGGCIVVLAWMDWRICLAALATLPSLIASTFFFRRFARENWRLIRTAVSRMTSRMAETLSGLDDIAIAGMQDRQRARYGDENTADYQANIRQMHLFAIFQPSFHIISVLALAAALVAGAYAVSGEMATVGTVIAAIGMVELLFRPVRDMAEKINVFQSALASAERVAEVIDSEPETQGGTRAPPDGAAIIRFEDVWFRYEKIGADADGKIPPWILQDFSATIGPGQRLALVGPSGSGKSTVVALLLRLYQPQRGQITCNGVPIEEYDLTAWRRRLGLVLQESALMAGTIEHNCRAGYDEVNDVQLAEAAQISGIDRLRGGGLQRALGEGGSGVSAGERQLIALTRALLGDPALLVLDEATAHIDSHAEASIQHAIDEVGQRFGLLVIAHRLATIRGCDEIIVLSKGSVSERGSHSSLMEFDGAYASLVRQHQGNSWG